MRSFSRSGFNGCSVQDITDDAGVPKGSFYNHFDSKEALGVAALDRFWQDKTCAWLELMAEPGRTPLQTLRHYFERGASDIAGRDYTCGCLAANMAAELSDHSPAVVARLATLFRQWSERVAARLADAQAAGEIDAGRNVSVLADFVLNAWEGAILRARIEKSDRPLRQFIDVTFDQFF